MAEALLTLNAGSSSLKSSLFQVDAGVPRAILRGEVEGLGSAPRFQARDPGGAVVEDRTWTPTDTPFEAILEWVVGWAETRLGPASLRAVGHRIVHGGADHVRPERVTPRLLTDLDRLRPLAPLHEPHNIDPIRLIAAARPGLTQVACFDTAFHATMPDVATRLALPRAYASGQVRRYGFHGLSYEYIARALAEISPAVAAGRVIAAHLGSGASLCAMRGGRGIETTMSFTALDGLVMSTRCGRLDPGLVIYLQRENGLSPDQVETMLWKQSGLLGVSGVSGDMRVLLASADPHAVEALDLFVYRIACETGALVSALEGLDGLVFTAGVGEHAPEIRARICGRLAWLGIVLDEAANAEGAPVISAPGSRVEVRVIPADEEMTIARHVLEVIGDADL